MKHVLNARWLLLLLAGGVAFPQETAPGSRLAMESALQGGMSGRWWTNPRIAQRLVLTPGQQKKMDEIFQESRLKLIDLTAALDKEEALLEPLVEADQPDAVKIRAQIDRIAQARGDLERANAYMLLGIRLVLTPGQWRDLRAGGGGPRARRLQEMEKDTSGAVPAGSSPVPKKSH